MRRAWIALVGLATAAVLAGGAPAQAAPAVYVAAVSDDSVFQYSVGPSGLLSPLVPPFVAAGDSPRGVAVSPDGGSVYVTTEVSGSVWQYTVEAGGTLAPKSPAAVAGGISPYFVA